MSRIGQATIDDSVPEQGVFVGWHGSGISKRCCGGWRVESVHHGDTSRHVLRVVGIRQSGFWVGVPRVVNVKAVSEPAFAHGVSVGEVDPFGPVFNALFSPYVANVDVEQYALVAH